MTAHIYSLAFTGPISKLLDDAHIPLAKVVVLSKMNWIKTSQKTLARYIIPNLSRCSGE